MTEAILDSGKIPSRTERRIGAFQGAGGGPLLLSVGAIHGNEHAGVTAARRVLDTLHARRPPFRGRFVALAGNVGALHRGVRFQDLDLNRIWLPERLDELRARDPDPAGAAEDEEQRDLLSCIAEELDAHGGPCFFLDLHTSSADGAPFLTVGDTLRNRAFARRLGLPLVLGLEEQIDGALLEYLNNRGHVTAGVEAGQHEDSSSVDHHEAVLWLALLAAGHLDEAHLPGAAGYRRLLREATPGIPRILEVRHRHVVRPGDRFVMKPAFRNFDPVRAGEEIARDMRGPIHAPASGLLLLPLYQTQGDDGFFTVTKIHPVWLRLSWLARRLGVPDWVTWLPGVRRHPSLPGTLLVDTRIARLFPLQIFHLLGFRKRRWEGDVLLVSRRCFDAPPGRVVHVASLDD